LAAARISRKSPAISDMDTDERTAGRWVWLGLVCDGAQQARVFYGAIFSWQFDTAIGGSGE